MIHGSLTPYRYGDEQRRFTFHDQTTERNPMSLAPNRSVAIATGNEWFSCLRHVTLNVSTAERPLAYIEVNIGSLSKFLNISRIKIIWHAIFGGYGDVKTLEHLVSRKLHAHARSTLSSIPFLSRPPRDRTIPDHFLKKEVIAASQEIQTIAGMPNTPSDKFVGAIFGQFVGDSIGLTTEFITRKYAQAIIKLGPLEYSTRFSTNRKFVKLELANDPVREDWRLNFPFYGHTDDSDQAICIVRALAKAKVDPSKTLQQHFAAGLISWRRHGIQDRDFTPQTDGRETPSCPEPRALGLGALVKAVIRDREDFLKDPKEQALRVWNNPKLAYGKFVKFKPAANGALMRTSPIAALYSKDFNTMVQRTIDLCEVTHVDPRCVASCVAANTAIFDMLNGEKDIKKIKEHAYEVSVKILKAKIEELRKATNFQFNTPEFATPEASLQKAIFADALEPLDLDDHGTLNLIGETYKCLGAAFATLSIGHAEIVKGRETEAFRTAITQLVGEGGDADTNAAIAGAMLGALVGYSKLPASWKQLRDQSVLLDIIRKCQ